MSTMRRTEDFHHTPEQIEGYLAEARRIMAEAGLEIEAYPQVLAQILALVSSKQVFYEQAAPALLGNLNAFKGH